MKKLLDIDIGREMEEGSSCLVKCFELLFKYYGYDISTYTMLGISECFDVRYKKADFDNTLISDIDINKSYFVEKFINEKLPVRVKRSFFQSFELGMKYIIDMINNNKPICIGVNSYHVSYCKDYHKTYGGIFHSYHMVVIKGFDDVTREIFVVDPALNINMGAITYEDFYKAWTDRTGIVREYVPYTFYEFRNKVDFKPYDKNYKCMYRSALDNLKKYFSNEEELIFNCNYYHGYYALLNMVDDLKKAAIYEGNPDFKNRLLDSIYNGISNLIRWTRKNFSLFMDNSVVIESEYSKEVYNELRSLFDKWTGVSIKLIILIKSKKYNKILKVADEIESLIKEEKCIINNLIDVLESAS